MDEIIIGEKTYFGIGYTFYDDTHETEIAMYFSGINILSFKRNHQSLTTRWDLDELVDWLRAFLDNLAEDPYPVSAEGDFAALKDCSARSFDSEDDEEFEAYYFKLNDWNQRHRWHVASSGAILANLYFQLVDDYVEVSWNNTELEPNVAFDSLIGGFQIKKTVFVDTVKAFLDDYSSHWFGTSRG